MSILSIRRYGVQVGQKAGVESQESILVPETRAKISGVDDGWPGPDMRVIGGATGRERALTARLPATTHSFAQSQPLVVLLTLPLHPHRWAM